MTVMNDACMQKTLSGGVTFTRCLFKSFLVA